MFSSLLIGLREGLEAALVVSILVAFLVKTGRRTALRWVWPGVASAVLLSVAVGALLTYTTAHLTFEHQELVGGVLSIVAVAFVTAMIFWMRTAARHISAELKGKMENALQLGPLAIALVSACDAPTAGTTPGAPGGPITVTASDNGCQVSTTTAPAGNITFQIANQGTKVTEFYLYGPGDRIMGELENIAPGLTRRLIVEVAESGTYQAVCKPGMAGAGIRSPFTVTGSTAKGAGANTQRAEAARSYAGYLSSQTSAFTGETKKFAEAIRAKDVTGAKAQYTRARIYYERIEPVAAKFGDLDPAIDAREADLQPGRKFTGFHRLEKDLWVTGLQPDSAAIADQLVVDVTTLGQKASTLPLTALDLANGAKSLLDEVATKKVTGEEETFSHTDLTDFQANVDGSRGAVKALRPILAERNPTLVSELEGRFADVQKLLDAQRIGEAFKLYTELTPDQVKQFASAVDALSEPLSRVAEVVAK